MKPYSWTDWFTDVGKVIKSANRCTALADDLDGDKTGLDAIFDDDAGDLDYLSDVLTTVDSARDSGTGSMSQFSELVSDYIRGIGRLKLEQTDTDRDDLIDDMIAKMNDAGTPQTVNGNAVTVLPAYTEAGDGSNQLSGYENLRGLSSDNVDASGILHINLVDDGGGFFHVELYSDSGLGPGDLVGHTATYNSTGAKAIIEDNASEMGGTITADALVAADNSITVTFLADGIRTGNGTLSTWAATQMAVDDDDISITCTSVAGGAGSEQWEVKSRLRGTASETLTTGSAWPSGDDELGVELGITAGGVAFVVGDQFLVKTYSDEDGVFQVFFRDQYAKTLPYELDGSETIADALAT